MNEEIPEVRTYEDLKAHEGKEVRVLGIYKQMNVNKHPAKEPVYNGRVFLELEDQRYVLLETDDEGMRDEAEISEFEGKKVSVRGIVRDHCTAWGGGMMASITGPCLKDIVELKQYAD